MKISLRKNGVATLVVLSVIAKAIGLLYRIPLFRVLGANGMGLYQLIFPLYALGVAFTGGGAPVAVSRSVSKEAADKVKNVEKTVDTALVIFGVTGLLLAVILTVFASYVSVFLGNIEAKLPLIVLAPSVFFSGIVAVFRGYCQGLGKTLKVGISYVVEQLFKLSGVALALLFSKADSSLAVVGAVSGITLGEILTALFLAVGYFKNKKGAFCADRGKLRELLSCGFAVSAGSLVMPVSSLIESVLVVNVLSSIVGKSDATALFGLLSGVVNPVLSMPSVVNSSFCSWFLPVLSSSGKKRRVQFGAYAKFPLALSLIITFSVCVFSKQILSVLYPLSESNLAVCCKLLAVGSPTVFLSCALSLITTYLQSVNKAHVPSVNLLIASLVRLLAIPFAIKSFSVYGAQVCTVVFYSVAFVSNCLRAMRNDFGFSAKTLYSIALSGLVYAFFALGIYLLVPTFLGCVTGAVTGMSSSCVVFALLTKTDLNGVLWEKQAKNSVKPR